jgi:hypothetical protein
MLPERAHASREFVAVRSPGSRKYHLPWPEKEPDRILGPASNIAVDLEVDNQAHLVRARCRGLEFDGRALFGDIPDQTGFAAATELNPSVDREFPAAEQAPLIDALWHHCANPIVSDKLALKNTSEAIRNDF